MKKSILTIASIIFTACTVFAQDIIYTVSGDYNGGNIPLNSIIVDNITNGTSITFSDLPENDYYQINLSKNAYWGTVDVFDIEKASSFSAVQNEPGLLSVIYRGKAAGKSLISIIDMSGKILYVENNLFLNPNNLVQIHIGTTGAYLIRIVSPYETKTFKAIGANGSEKYSINLLSDANTKTQKSAFLKSTTVIGEGDFHFEVGDSIRFWAFKSEKYTMPAHTSIEESEDINFQFEDIVYLENISAYPDSVGEIIKFAVDGDTLTCIKIDSLYIYQEDILLTEEEVYGNSLKGGSISNLSKLWSNGIVPYVIGENALESFADNIYKAINYWNLNAPVKFIERTSETKYIKFAKTSIFGTSSYQGNVGLYHGGVNVWQPIWINEKTSDYGSIMHEMGHAAGLIHEQSRVDRDIYVDVNIENVKLLQRKNYSKNTSSLVAGEYDFNSLMGYPSTGGAFAKNIEIPILTKKKSVYPNQDTTWVQQNSYLSRGDIQMLEELYGANATKRPQIEFVKFENEKYYNYSVDNFSVEFKGYIIDNGESDIIEKGAGLIKEGEKYIDYYPTENGIDNFAVSINNLEPCTNYYFFVYATNSYGMRTSEYREFYTYNYSINSSGTENLSSNSVTLLGSTQYFCRYDKLVAGFVLCNSSGEFKGSETEWFNETETDSFHSNISDLRPDSTYYFKAYTNAYIDAIHRYEYYSEIDSFTTLKEDTAQSGTFTYQGKTYKTITIGGKEWMAENLAYDVGDGCWAYYNDESNVATYGRLYNWEAAKAACPAGWHLPTDEEWKQLEMAIGMSQSEVDKTGDRGTNEGSKLKATSGWENNGNGTDDFGFSALPGGYSDHDGYFYLIGKLGFWWTATKYDDPRPWYRHIDYDEATIYRYFDHYGFIWGGKSVRYVRD